MGRDGAAFAAGCKAAQTDIAAGRFVYRWSGHAGHWGHWIVTEYEKRFGVMVDDGFGICLVTEAKVSFNNGYNSVLIAELDRWHGTGAFQSLIVESRSVSEEELWDARQAWLKRHGMDEPENS